VDTDWGDGRDHCGRLPDGRAGAADLLPGLHTDLGVPGALVHVVRRRQLFREKNRLFERRHYRAHRLPVLGGPDCHTRRRVAHRGGD